MNTVTAKQLKQSTGEIIKRVRSGEQLTVTYRGKPVAVIVLPPESQLDKPGSFDEVWKGIEDTLRQTEPEFKGWQEAVKWVRKRI
ncbi:MAG: type II toxin-antitoxin system prevent-host-death family antitoxin [Deltaproteobacteria bacterium]|nr:type II toxin-antitoxin system prevent-host-death family antitoxin [Deltaproteobacteria bacterium]